MIRFILCLVLFSQWLQAEVYYEGTATFRGYGKVDLNWLVQFMPYNPVILVAGSNCDDVALNAKQVWPKSRVIALEPNQRALEPLDDWCQQNQVDHIDILKLDLDGTELYALQSSPEMLKRVHIIILPSFFYAARPDTVNYFILKDFLTKSHFVPLAHWYTAGERGTAVYVSEEMYDAYFVRCLGLGLGGISYP